MSLHAVLRQDTMNNPFPGRASNIPYAFNPTTNHDAPPAVGSSPQVNTTQDRIIVGVDFGTTYSGMVNTLDLM